MSDHIPPFDYNVLSKDVQKAIITLVIIIVCALFVSNGKLDISVFMVVITGVSGYYLGKSSNQGSLLDK